MGQEQSGSAAEPVSAAPTLLERVKNVGTPRMARSDKIVVVSYGADKPQFEPMEDENYIKLQNIPQFYPILRSLLHNPTLKDPPDLYTKFSARPVSLLANRLTEHMQFTVQQVEREQNGIITRIKEIDLILSTLGGHMAERMKAYEQFSNTANKINEINQQLKKVTQQLQVLVPEIRDTNNLLPLECRLDPLDLSPICDENLLHALQRPLILDSPELEPNVSSPLTDMESNIDEQLVIDQDQTTS